MAKKKVITAALTGVLATRAQSPNIPYTPEEIRIPKITPKIIKEIEF